MGKRSCGHLSPILHRQSCGQWAKRETITISVISVRLYGVPDFRLFVAVLSTFRAGRPAPRSLKPFLCVFAPESCTISSLTAVNHSAMRFSTTLGVLAGLVCAADAAQTVGLYPPPTGSVADFIGRVHGFINPTDFRVSGP